MLDFVDFLNNGGKELIDPMDGWLLEVDWDGFGGEVFEWVGLPAELIILKVCVEG